MLENPLLCVRILRFEIQLDPTAIMTPFHYVKYKNSSKLIIIWPFTFVWWSNGCDNDDDMRE